MGGWQAVATISACPMVRDGKVITGIRAAAPGFPWTTGPSTAELLRGYSRAEFASVLAGRGLRGIARTVARTDFTTAGEIGPPPVCPACRKAHRNVAFRQEGSIQRFDEREAGILEDTTIKS